MLSNIQEIRNQFPFLKEVIYIDAAHYTPYPLFVVKRLNEFIDKFTTTYYNMSQFNLEFAAELRQWASKLINADPEEIAVTNNATHGINIFANGLELPEDKNVVAFLDSEFPSVVYTWMNLERSGRVRVFKIPSSLGYINETKLKKLLLENNVNVFNLSHVQFLGYKYDIKSIAEFCNKNDILLLVDAIQSTGINPIDVKEMGINCLCTGNQKWFMSPAGTGFMYLSEKYRNFVNPTYVSTINVEYDFTNFLNYKLNFKNDCRVYENSTPNTLGMIGFTEVIKYFIELGVENIFEHIIDMQNVLIEELDNKEYKIMSDMNNEHRSNILLISHNDKTKNQDIQKYLENKKIIIAYREGYLRISPHIYNNQDDMKKIADLLNTYKN